MLYKLDNPIREEFRIGTRVPRRATPPIRQYPVTVYRVHPLVWRAAQHAAGGEVARIERISETEVVVR